VCYRPGPAHLCRRLFTCRRINGRVGARRRRRPRPISSPPIILALNQYSGNWCSPGRSRDIRTTATGSNDDSRDSGHDRCLGIAFWPLERPPKPAKQVQYRAHWPLQRLTTEALRAEKRGRKTCFKPLQAVSSFCTIRILAIPRCRALDVPRNTTERSIPVAPLRARPAADSTCQSTPPISAHRAASAS